tara:strand:+ start:359 stop:1411 length:1053 start_codon:yes stop_codon:yes gene_type:complete
MVKKNLFIDISWIDDRLSGGGRFSIENVLKSIISNKKFNELNIIFILNKNILKKFGFLKIYKKIYLTENKYLNFVIRFFILFLLYKKEKNQIYFCPNIYSPIFKLNFKIINLFHDAQWIKFPKNFSFLRKFWIWFNISICKHKSDKIIFTSKSLKKDLNKKFNFKNKTYVIYLPFFIKKKVVKKIFNKKSNSYMICISSRLPHKNLETLEKLFIRYKNQIKEKLIIAGLGNDTKKKNYSNITYLNYLGEKKKNWLIQNSKCVLLPSLYEGFGMVAVETVLNGTRVVASNLSVYKELLGNNIDYVSSPKNIKNWLKIISKLKKNKNFNQKKILKKFNHKIISNKYFSCIVN